MRSRRQKRRDSLQETLLNTCAWCGDRIPEGSEVFSLSAKIKPGIDLTRQEGRVVPMTLESVDRVVLAIVPTPDSPAKKQGNDVLFMICSDSCGSALREALARELNV